MDPAVYQKALNKTKIQLMSREDSAFFTTVCFSLAHIWDSAISTAATNGKEIRFNPSFFMELSQEGRVSLLLHETLHVAFLHMDRLESRDHSKWNVAADHVINLMLKSRGFLIPEDWLADAQYQGMSTEQVYALLPPQVSRPDNDLVAGDGPPEDLRRDVEDILVRAAIQSKMQNDKPGSIPESIELFLNKLLKPKLPWHRILQKYIQSRSKNDYSFRKPNRRFFPEHHLPSLYSEKVVDMAIAVDISGSVSPEEFSRFITEINSVMKMMKPDKISLIQFDTVIHEVDELRNVYDLSRVRFKGRGGTNITPVMEWANTHKPQVLLVFTDGYFAFRECDTTKMNTVWLIHDNQQFTAKFGKVIHYEIEEA